LFLAHLVFGFIPKSVLKRRSSEAND